MSHEQLIFQFALRYIHDKQPPLSGWFAEINNADYLLSRYFPISYQIELPYHGRPEYVEVEIAVWEYLLIEQVHTPIESNHRRGVLIIGCRGCGIEAARSKSQ